MCREVIRQRKRFRLPRAVQCGKGNRIFGGTNGGGFFCADASHCWLSVFFMTMNLPWERGFMAVISQKSLLLVGYGKLLERVFLQLLIVICLQHKIICMSKWHFWGGIFWPSTHAIYFPCLFVYGLTSTKALWRQMLSARDRKMKNTLQGFHISSYL